MAKSNASISNSSGGLGFFGFLTLIFITLKLTDNINWTWWWVLSPIWICVIIYALLILVAAIWIALKK